MRRIEFVFGDLIDPDDPVDRWLTTLSMGWNDLSLANRRLLDDLDNENVSLAETLYDARLVSACVWEISKFLRESEQNWSEIAEAIRHFPPDLRDDYEQALRSTSSAASADWFRGKLANARHTASHYWEMDRKHLAAAIRKLQKEQAAITVGDAFGELRADFADDVAADLFFRSDNLESDLTRFIKELTIVVTSLMRFLRGVLKLHLDQHADAWRVP